MTHTKSGSVCPFNAEHRLEAIHARVEAARLKIESLALLGDLLGEQVRACEERRAEAQPEAVADSPLACGRPRCHPGECVDVQSAERLEQAYDRLAERVAALHREMEAARRGLQPDRRRRKRRGPPPLAPAAQRAQTIPSSSAPTP